MASKKTTAQKLKTKKTYEAQERLLLAWKDNWHDDQKKTIDVLQRAILDDDKDKALYLVNALLGMTQKRFGTLENMIHIINNRDYDLVHRQEDEDELFDEYE